MGDYGSEFDNLDLRIRGGDERIGRDQAGSVGRQLRGIIGRGGTTEPTCKILYFAPGRYVIARVDEADNQYIFPEGLELRFAPMAWLEPAEGVELVIRGSIRAGCSQIFAGGVFPILLRLPQDSRRISIRGFAEQPSGSAFGPGRAEETLEVPEKPTVRARAGSETHPVAPRWQPLMVSSGGGQVHGDVAWLMVDPLQLDGYVRAWNAATTGENFNAPRFRGTARAGAIVSMVVSIKQWVLDFARYVRTNDQAISDRFRNPMLEFRSRLRRFEEVA